MCGIAGIVRFDRPVSKNEIESMTASLAHRGPDGEGIWVGRNAALGHRRLSIIDLETGRQPMCNEDETVWITYNGEIYNYRQLREQLSARGRKFRTHSDTEVIIHAYEEWGDDCVTHFRGMFAFGIVDTKKQRVFLARDHMGIKPLVYYEGRNCFAFSSEIQALRKVEGAVLEMDLQAVDQYLTLQYIPAPRSIYHQVKKLPPAHRMSISLDGRQSEPEPYWSVGFRPNRSKNESDWLEELDAVLHDSVKSHLVADVPFGAFLSGGVDSGAIVAYMAQILGAPVKTFSIGFAEDEYNELKYAEMMAKRWGTEHHFEIVKPDALGILPSLVSHYGEPFGDSSAIPTYYVSKLARKHVPMVLTGDGGDELFGGYHSYLSWMTYLENDPGRHRPLWKKMGRKIAQRLFPQRYPPIPFHGESLDNWLSMISYMPGSLRHNLWRKDYQSITKHPLEAFEKEYDRTQSLSKLNRVQYMDLKTYLPFDILTKVDIASMVHGLETRTPFVDINVIEFALSIPEQFNMKKNTKGEWEGKLLLKKAMKKYYPAELVDRKKMGFGVPLQEWFEPKGSLAPLLREKLLGQQSKVMELFEPSVVEGLLEKNASGQIWLILFLEEWLQGANCGIAQN